MDSRQDVPIVAYRDDGNGSIPVGDANPPKRAKVFLAQTSYECQDVVAAEGPTRGHPGKILRSRLSMKDSCASAVIAEDREPIFRFPKLPAETSVALVGNMLLFRQDANASTPGIAPGKKEIENRVEIRLSRSLLRE